MSKIEAYLNSILVLIISGVIISAFGVQFFLHEEPCPLCLLQRMCMLGAASGALLNLQFGVRMSHYGLILTSCLMGGFIALRQVALHVCPQFPHFGIPVFGVSLYTWSFFVFVSTIAYVALLLFIHNPAKNIPLGKNRIVGTAFLLAFVVTIINIFATFAQCGLGPCSD